MDGRGQCRRRGRTGLVGNDDVLPVLLLDGLDDGAGHALADGHRLVGVALLERLADAEDNLETLAEGGGRLLRDELRRVLEERPALGVTNERPVDRGVDKHVGRDLAREGTLLLRVDVLGRERDLGRRGLGVGLDVLLRGDQVERGDGDDDLWRKTMG
jgi:hypothetical protein